ncbi:hypothetical protein DLAC_11674 [Tieghemostelium lacteum]|uniref:Uncharacterized protein n=1 Tax=Tieghemostelium lacteum TaxID=361077 RepID=A0A151ZE13_TIELA|nr:hypothetical protein DLAC_11674 [Tieghemostelium lacteum]|eukprot:KYQ92150.1 hypothetical protein DLAC_11674 [Tieghemostelium lacteum]
MTKFYDYTYKYVNNNNTKPNNISNNRIYQPTIDETVTKIYNISQPTIELSPVLSSQPNLPTIITPLTTEDRYLYNIPPTQTPLPNNLLNPYPTIPSLSSSEYSFGHISSQPIPQQYQHNRSTQTTVVSAI